MGKRFGFLAATCLWIILYFTGAAAAIGGPPPQVCAPGSTFSFAGVTYDTLKTPLNGTNITMEVYEFGQMGPTLNSTFSTLSNATGHFNLTGITGDPQLTYKMQLRYYNGTIPNKVDYIGQIVPDLPCFEVATLGSVNFYLREAATINITAVGEEEELDNALEGANTSVSAYGTGLEWISENSLWAYLNTSGYLILLNSNFTPNSSSSQPVIDGPTAFHYNGSGVYYAANTTTIVRFAANGTATAEYDITGRNYTNVTGFEYNPADGYFYLSGMFQVDVPPSGPPVVSVDTYDSSFTLTGSMNGSVPFGKLALYGGDWYMARFDSGRGSWVVDKFNSGWTPLWTWTFNKSVDGLVHDGSGWYYGSANDSTIASFSLTDGGVKSFGYYVKDTKLGYPVAEYFNNDLQQATVHLPADRNYSIEMFPSRSMPVSYDLNNISAYGTSPLINIVFNITERMKWFSGYVSYNGSSNFEDLKIVPYLLEPGNMVFSTYPMPFNMSIWRKPFNTKSDSYNASQGFYNITLPGSAMGADIMLFITAKNGTNVYGAFQNITLWATDSDISNRNFTLQPLIGNLTNISMDNAADFNTKVNVTTKKKTFKLQNSTGSSPNNAFVEFTVDYTPYFSNSTGFSWMVDVGQGAGGSFTLPVLDAKVKETNVYSPDFAPRSTSLSTSDLAADPVVITLKSFKPGGINETFNDLLIDMIISNSTCNVPNPPNGCSLFPSEKNMSDFNPLTLIIGGGDISFRMKKQSNNITVHYNNVDLLASGPPDALFDGNSSNATVNGTLAEAWRFGSSGPEIYDSILLGVPYNESDAPDASNFSVRISLLYDDNWNVIWNISLNTTAEVPSEYSAYLTDKYNAYLNSSKSAISCSKTNTTSTCYVDTTADMIWMQIPHFSGVGPQVLQETPAPSTSPSSTPSSGGGGGGLPSIGPGEEVLLVANSIDHALAVDFLQYLDDNNIAATVVNASSFTDEMKVENRLIIILGGPDAPEGIGDIVSGLLTGDETALIRASGSQLIFTKYDVFTYRYTSRQKVIILAGSDRTNTKAAEERHSDEAKTRVLR